MCTTCGCGSDQARGVDAAGAARDHVHAHEHAHAHEHEHEHEHEREHEHSHAHAHRHSHESPSPRMLRIEEDILARNNVFASGNRERLAARGVFALNLVSSPGSGKTTLLVKTIEAMRGRIEIAVIEGDQQTELDAERIRASGARAVQINTGKGCHLDAHMVGHALERLEPREASVLAIENVGNLVCPAAFDLGEAHKIVVLSVTEGEDKPLKYPDMFRQASLMLLNKIDLLPYLEFDVGRCIGYARRVNPDIEIIPVSAASGEGMGEWFDWLARGADRARAACAPNVAQA